MTKNIVYDYLKKVSKSNLQTRLLKHKGLLNSGLAILLALGMGTATSSAVFAKSNNSSQKPTTTKVANPQKTQNKSNKNTVTPSKYNKAVANRLNQKPAQQTPAQNEQQEPAQNSVGAANEPGAMGTAGYEGEDGYTAQQPVGSESQDDTQTDEPSLPQTNETSVNAGTVAIMLMITGVMGIGAYDMLNKIRA